MKEVKQQIRSIILNTKEEAESIGTIAKGTSGELADNSRIAVDKIQKVTEDVVRNV